MKRLLLAVFAVCLLAGSAYAQYEYKFTEIKRNAATPVKDQGTSGTCWCFGTTSFFESEIIRKGGPVMDLSEMYTVRWNYIEKTRDNYLRDGKGRIGTGSIPHMVINIWKKYGCVPESVYPGMNYDSPTGLHWHNNLTKWIKDMSNFAVAQKEGYPEKIFSALLDSYLGDVPEKFTYNGKEYTPMTFFKSLDINLDDYVELTSFSHHPFYEAIPVEVPDNWDHKLMYNLPLDEWMSVIDNAINMGYTVSWDGDLSNNGYDFSKSIALNTDFDLKHSETIPSRCKEIKVTQENRQYRFETFDLEDDHIEHIVGIAKDQEGVKYYITKNSWGVRRNPDGYHYMSEEYVKANTICYLVHKNCIPKEIRKKLGL